MKQTFKAGHNVKIEHFRKGEPQSFWNPYIKAFQNFRIPFITGQYLPYLKIHNLVPSAGLAGVSYRLNRSATVTHFTYIALGSSNTAAAAGQTALISEHTSLGLGRQAATVSQTITSVTDDTARLVYTFTATGAADVSESGTLNAAAGGTLLARQVFATISVAANDTLQVTWDFVFANA